MGMSDKEKRASKWGQLAWWVVVCHSVPFALYAVPFALGKFEIYRHMTLAMNYPERAHLAGLNILQNIRTWQSHSIAAIIFVIIGPLQFNTSFRDKHRVVHKRLGYVFALATIITAVTGSTTMVKASDLGPLALGSSKVMGPLTLIYLVISVNAARKRDFQKHRRWMLRSAAIGYGVMYSRSLPQILIPVFKLSLEDAIDYSMIVSWALNILLAELYIQAYWTPRKRVGKPAMEGSLVDESVKKVP